MGLGGRATKVWVRWPDGTETETPLAGEQREVVIRR
jgi:hypothetical protein